MALKAKNIYNVALHRKRLLILALRKKNLLTHMLYGDGEIDLDHSPIAFFFPDNSTPW